MVEAAAANQHGGPFRAHVVVFPFPAQAHIRPVILLSKSLAAVYDVAVTFVSTTPELDSTRRGFEGEDERFQDHRNNIRLVSVDMQPVEYGMSTILNFQKLQRATSNLRDTFAELMKELRDSSTSNGTNCDPSAPPSTDHNFGPPLCIISDMWLGWAQDIADEFKVPIIFTVGPLLEGICNQASTEKSQAAGDDNHECLQWLSKQSRESLLYICFGTETTHEKQQMNEIALGLEASQVHFL